MALKDYIIQLKSEAGSDKKDSSPDHQLSLFLSSLTFLKSVRHHPSSQDLISRPLNSIAFLIHSHRVSQSVYSYVDATEVHVKYNRNHSAVQLMTSLELPSLSSNMLGATLISRLLLFPASSGFGRVEQQDTNPRQRPVPT
jgi:hypothetical protein